MSENLLIHISAEQIRALDMGPLQMVGQPQPRLVDEPVPASERTWHHEQRERANRQAKNERA